MDDEKLAKVIVLFHKIFINFINKKIVISQEFEFLFYIKN